MSRALAGVRVLDLSDRSAALGVGEHNEDILKNLLNLPDSEIVELLSKNVLE